jgi:hypothetical protein
MIKATISNQQYQTFYWFCYQWTEISKSKSIHKVGHAIRDAVGRQIIKCPFGQIRKHKTKRIKNESGTINEKIKIWALIGAQLTH